MRPTKTKIGEVRGVTEGLLVAKTTPVLLRAEDLENFLWTGLVATVTPAGKYLACKTLLDTFFWKFTIN